MIKPEFRHILAALLTGLLAANSLAADWQINTLMQQLALSKSGHASFVEKKYIGIVDKPVVSSGELFFTAPDKLEKRTLKPRAESLVLDGQRLTIDRPDKARLSLNLQDYPEAAAFVESIRGTLAGDKSALEKVYRLTLNGTQEKWQLILLPKYSRMSDLVSRIVVNGTQGEIRRIDFDLPDGDRSEMLVTKVAAQ
ncbi:MAG: putative transrane protein [Proteobacteria bacterium]|nr:putative transrane protein [Pseudomonadota bacterium]